MTTSWGRKCGTPLLEPFWELNGETTLRDNSGYTNCWTPGGGSPLWDYTWGTKVGKTPWLRNNGCQTSGTEPGKLPLGEPQWDPSWEKALGSIPVGPHWGTPSGVSTCRTSFGQRAWGPSLGTETGGPNLGDHKLGLTLGTFLYKRNLLDQTWRFHWGNPLWATLGGNPIRDATHGTHLRPIVEPLWGSRAEEHPGRITKGNPQRVTQ